MTENTQTASQKWVERFGAIENIVARTDRNGKAYATFTIATPKFKQNAIAFGETAQKVLAVEPGTRIWSKGPIAFKTVQVEGEDKQVGDFTAIYFNVSTPKTKETAEPVAEVVAEEPVAEVVAEVVAEEPAVKVERKRSRKAKAKVEAEVIEDAAENAFA